MKKTSVFTIMSILTTVPAFADIAANESNPTCDATTIGVSSGNTSLDAVWNIVNSTCSSGQYFDTTTATCVTCTANSYCPGGTYNVESQTNGLNSCPNGYAYSATGAGASTDCYRSCTTSDVAHSNTVSGNVYYNGTNGAGISTCVPETCANGWHVKAAVPDVQTLAGTSASSVYGYVNNSGSTQQSATTYGLTSSDKNTYVIDYGTGKGIVFGQGRCSTQSGTNNNNTWSNPTTFANLTDETGQEGATYCYCNVTGYKSSSESALQSLSSSWVFNVDLSGASNCTSSCAYNCAFRMRSTGAVNLAFRAAVLGSVGASPASCEANTINITWYNENEVHEQNQCTYSESVTLPATEPERTGYTFDGWRVRQSVSE